MRRLARVLKSIYDFFAGDHIILGGVAVAFGLTAALARLGGRLLPLDDALFVALIIGALALTLGREVMGRKKSPR